MAKTSLVQGGKTIKGGKKYTDPVTGKTTNQSTVYNSGAVTTKFGMPSGGSPVIVAPEAKGPAPQTGVAGDAGLFEETAQEIRRSSGPSPALTALSIANSPTVSSKSGATSTGSYQTSAVGSGKRYSRYGLDDEDYPTVQQPTYEEIQKQLTRDAQKEINSLHRYEKSLLDEQKESNQEAMRQNAAINTLTGLAGSTEADRTTDKVRSEGLKANERIMAAINTQVQSVLSNVRKDARDLYQFERSEARLDETARQAQQTARQEKASSDVTILAQSGATAEGFAQTDPEGYQYLASQVGGEQILKSMFTLNRPQETVLDKRIEGGKYVIAYQNPLDGKVRLETVDLGLPVGYSKTIDAGNRILAVPDNWSGDPSELITINKGLTPQQQLDQDTTQPGENPRLYSGLDSKTATAVRSKVTKFTSEPIVQNFATVQEGNNFAQAIDTKTTNPADDQALIYSLAKALDPGSVVREGEYATAQKYAQSWINAYGKGVEQAILGTGFLSEDARSNIKKTIAQKYDASKRSYSNIYSQYSKSIDNLTGRSNGSEFLIDYATPADVSSGGSKILQSPNGEQYDASELTDEEYQQAVNDGYMPI